MLPKQLLEPFRYRKIPLQPIRQERVETAVKPMKTIKRLWRYVAQEKWKLIFVMSMVLGSSALALLGPFMVGKTIDRFIVKPSTTGLPSMLFLLICIYCMHSLTLFLQRFTMVGIAQQTVYRLRKDLFEQFHQLPIAYFDQHQHGELMSRVTNDVDNINTTLNQSVTDIISSLMMLIGTLAVMLYLSPPLTLITMMIVPLMLIAMRWITKRTGPLYKLQQHDLGVMNGFVEETISGQHVIKTYSQEKRVIQQFNQRNEQLKQSGFWSSVFAGFIPKTMNMLNVLSFGLIALFGGIFAINQLITVGVIVIFVEYARQFTRPLNELSNQFNVLLSAIAGAERVFSVLDEQHEERDEQFAQHLPEVNGAFQFQNVYFSYDQEPTLQDISFSVKPGETVAFVGHTGAGKSTIFHLISRFYHYDAGEITLDGIPLPSIKRASLRSQMAFVLQDSFLFKGTIRENIRYGRLDASDDDVVMAAKQANAHRFIMTLDDTYDTMLEPSGGGISEGQKQLITIARAFIARPKILLLDEATSTVDTITEMHIQHALEDLMKERTSFVIAHRLNTIKGADKIVFLEQGRVVEFGTHRSLMAAQGKYYRLFTSSADA